MRKDYRKIEEEIRDQVKQLVDENGIVHASRESGWDTSSLYRMIRGESKMMTVKKERALLQYIRKFGPKKKPKAKSSASPGDLTVNAMSGTEYSGDNGHSSDDGGAPFLLCKLKLSDEQAAAMLRLCNAHDIAPSTWVKTLVKEALQNA